MPSTEFATYCRLIRLENNPARLAAIRAELDREHQPGPDSADSDALVKIATLKRVRFLESN